MRIARVANFSSPTSGGLRTTLDAVGLGYHARDHAVLTVLPGDQDRESRTDAGDRLALHSPALPGGYRLLTRLGAVRDALDAFAPDVLEIHDRTTLLRLAPWARATGVRTVFVAHERLDGVLAQTRLPLGRLASPVGRFQAEWIAANVDTVVATTQYAAQEFAAIGARVQDVPLGVDLETFDPRRHSTVARDILASPDEVLLVLASRLAAQKRPDLAIEAARTLTERGRRVRLLVAGTGPAARGLRSRAAGLPVSFLGFISERTTLAGLLATADAVIAPGPIETFGLAALESLACGTPVVCHADSALPEVVAHAGAAAPGSGTRFADAIEEVLSRDARERRLEARRRAAQFPWDRTVTRMLRLHRRAREGAAG